MMLVLLPAAAAVFTGVVLDPAGPPDFAKKNQQKIHENTEVIKNGKFG